jgi:hypothetical protein
LRHAAGSACIVRLKKALPTCDERACCNNIGIRHGNKHFLVNVGMHTLNRDRGMPHAGIASQYRPVIILHGK